MERGPFGIAWRRLAVVRVDAAVGTMARDHLANERTFLALLRTAVILSGVGVSLHLSAVRRGTAVGIALTAAGGGTGWEEERQEETKKNVL
ncbi:hypothetical protein I4F81_000423 [Pyropia yezoensis]|uniref:Uncharacterized protein n=1 Tax=Pyropia yezoensis TaxID=2788 RepID=A0ACC3BIP6_PYRYE|nr:hypothetical protein I4F81_000423 [Neopyropia yezoensis]